MSNVNSCLWFKKKKKSNCIFILDHCVMYLWQCKLHNFPSYYRKKNKLTFFSLKEIAGVWQSRNVNCWAKHKYVRLLSACTPRALHTQQPTLSFSAPHTYSIFSCPPSTTVLRLSIHHYHLSGHKQMFRSHLIPLLGPPSKIFIYFDPP